MKKVLTIVFAALALVALAACNATPAETFDAPADVVGFEAISATELLAQSLTPTANVAQPLAFARIGEETTEPTDDEETAVDDELVDVDKYLAMIEQFLGNTNGLAVTVESSDLTEYTYKMTYVTKNLFGDDVTYVLYYNEVLYEEPVDEPNDELTTTTATVETTTEEATTTVPLSDRLEDEDRLRNREFEFADEDDDAIRYALTGMLLIGDATYYLEGKKIVNDNEEVMMLRSFVDHDNFVKVRYQTEDGDKKFFYEIVTAGVVVNKSKIMVKTEDDQVKVQLSFIEGEAKGRYQFMLETEGSVTYIKVMYDVEDAEGVTESGNIRIEATYDELTGLTTYTYVVLPARKGNMDVNPKEHEFHIDRDNGYGADQGGHGGKNQAV